MSEASDAELTDLARAGRRGGVRRALRAPSPGRGRHRPLSRPVGGGRRRRGGRRLRRGLGGVAKRSRSTGRLPVLPDGVRAQRLPLAPDPGDAAADRHHRGRGRRAGGGRTPAARGSRAVRGGRHRGASVRHADAAVWQHALWITAVEERSSADVSRESKLSPNATAAPTMRARQAFVSAYLAEHVSTTSDPACAAVAPLLAPYVRDRLGVAERARVEEHLAQCDACTTAVDDLRDPQTRACGPCCRRRRRR